MLIAGTAIGGGVLALPILSGTVGLIPSLVMCLITCLMTTTTGWIMGKKYIENAKQQSLQQFYEEILGKWGKKITSLLFLLFGTLLLIAYIKGIGNCLSEALSLQNFGQNVTFVLTWLLLTLLLLCEIRLISIFNSVCVILMIGLFAFLTIPCFKKFQYTHVALMNWNLLPTLFPVFVGSFAFQGSIPAICKQCNNDKKVLLWSLLLGTGTTCLIYAIFLICTLGVIPRHGDRISIDYAFKNGFPVTVVLGNILKNTTLFSFIGLGISILAMATSFIGVSEGLVQFIKDGFSNNISKKPSIPIKRNTILIVTLSIVLCLLFTAKTSFVQAIVWVGVICGILFGLLPCFAWLKDSLRGKSLVNTALSLALFILFALALYFEARGIFTE